MTDRPKRAPAPDLPPFEALDAVHAQVLETLKQLDALMAHLDTKGLDSEARHAAAGITEFFSTHARAHHEQEDRTVFPGLLKDGRKEVVDAIHRLQQDHGWLEEDWRLLQPQLDAIAEGIGGYDMEMLRRAVPVFNTLYREHIAVEEALIYPAAKRAAGLAGQGKSTRS